MFHIGQSVLNNLRRSLKYSLVRLLTYGLSISWKTHIFEISDPSIYPMQIEIPLSWYFFQMHCFGELYHIQDLGGAEEK